MILPLVKIHIAAPTSLSFVLSIYTFSEMHLVETLVFIMN